MPTTMTSTTTLSWTQRGTAANELLTTILEDDDGVLENILGFMDTIKLCAKRRVNRRWRKISCKAIEGQRKKAFSDGPGGSNELRQAVADYCGRIAKKDRVRCIYGPVIGKWDVSQVTIFRQSFIISQISMNPLGIGM
jgi:F-box domain